MPKTPKTVPFERTLKWYSATGLIHTLISVSVFVMSLLNIIEGKEIFYYTIQILSLITAINSIIWITLGIILFVVAHKLKNTKSTAHTRWILFLSLFFVLTPDMLMIILFWLPMLKDSTWINIIGLLSPVLVFIGWFIGKRMIKNIQHPKR